MSLKEILEKPGRHYDSGHRCDYRVTVEAALQHLAATPSVPVTDWVWEAAREALEALDVFESAYKQFNGILPDGFPAAEFRKVAGAGEPLRAALATRAAPPLPESPWRPMATALKTGEWVLLRSAFNDYTINHGSNRWRWDREQWEGDRGGRYQSSAFDGWHPAAPDSQKGGEDARKD